MSASSDPSLRFGSKRPLDLFRSLATAGRIRNNVLRFKDYSVFGEAAN